MIMVWASEVEKTLNKYEKRLKKGEESQACKMTANYLENRGEIGIRSNMEMQLVELLKDVSENIDIKQT